MGVAMIDPGDGVKMHNNLSRKSANLASHLPLLL
jgi:hypothetical protein